MCFKRLENEQTRVVTLAGVLMEAQQSMSTIVTVVWTVLTKQAFVPS